MTSGQDSARLASGTSTPRSIDSTIQGRPNEGTFLLGIAAVESDYAVVDYGATGKASSSDGAGAFTGRARAEEEAS